MNLSALEKSLSDNKISFEKNKSMSLLTSFHIGGPADIVIFPSKTEDISLTKRLCSEFSVPVTVSGKGSNLLVSDDGIEGAVICLSGEFDGITEENGTVFCNAGTPLTALCNFCLEHSLSGLEFAFGIPGSVGGAIYMNAGAYGGEMKDVVRSVEYLEDDGTVTEYSGEELMFGYRSSIFKKKNGVIISAAFSLYPESKEEISQRMTDFMTRRRTKQPLNLPSAGSVFKRPQGNFAGALIESSNLKGFTIGGAQVSEKHAGFIVNIGGATCSDVEQLIEHIKETVYNRCGVMLEPELIKIGR